MIQLSHSEYVTSLFVIAMYHWFIDDDVHAKAVLAVANMAARLPLMSA